MRRIVFAFLLFVLSASIASAQQVPSTYSKTGNSPGAAANTSDETLTTPPQIRRVDPPSPDMSAEQLENTADDLRFDKMYADAMDYLKAAIKKSPNAVLYNKMGMVEIAMEKLREAKRDFEKSTKLDPNYPDALNNLGVVYYKTHKFTRAIKYYQQALALNEQSAHMHSNLGTAYFAHQEFEKAASEYIRAVELDPTVFETYSRVGVSGHIPYGDDRAHFNYVIARSFAATGDTERSLLYLRKAMEEGYKKINDVYMDNEFSMVRKDPRFVTLMNERPVAINPDR